MSEKDIDDRRPADSDDQLVEVVDWRHEGQVRDLNVFYRKPDDFVQVAFRDTDDDLEVGRWLSADEADDMATALNRAADLMREVERDQESAYRDAAPAASQTSAVNLSGMPGWPATDSLLPPFRVDMSIVRPEDDIMTRLTDLMVAFRNTEPPTAAEAREIAEGCSTHGPHPHENDLLGKRQCLACQTCVDELTAATKPNYWERSAG